MIGCTGYGNNMCYSDVCVRERSVITEIPAGFNEIHTTLSHQTAALRLCVVVNVRRGFRD